MSRFPDVLLALSEQLSLPQPTRSRVLLEVADDLEGLYQHYVRSGLDDALARRRTIETLDLTPEVVAGLLEVHASPYQRFLDHLSARARTRWERGLLVVLSALVGIVVLVATNAHPVLTRANASVWLVLSCFVAAAVVELQLLVAGRTRAPRSAQRSLRAALGLTVAQPLVGAAGAWLGLMGASQAVLAGERQLGPALMDWVYGAVALLLVAIGGAIVTALWWFALAGRAAADEEHEVHLLLETKPKESTS
jgi:hypothetical protein